MTLKIVEIFKMIFSYFLVVIVAVVDALVVPSVLPSTIGETVVSLPSFVEFFELTQLRTSSTPPLNALFVISDFF